ncbi:hypothetical protein EK21DRAFT_112600 [Setomelanomma holmii]|uniref:Protein kinase domain-containing protein n=1 Tax=Setomelanomma holmii TaxID=210430 RepID=A0A9P4H7M0_9PLEO|nr:hypothetical protein EK21DRAFT_112600 [Setomelanomma holmii]
MAAPIPQSHLFRTIKLLAPGTYLCLLRTYTSAEDDSPQRMRQQSRLLTHSLASTLIQSIKDNGASKLQDKYIALLPRLIVVKTYQDPDRIKPEFAPETASRWLIHAAVFGPTLKQLGEAVSKPGAEAFYLSAWFSAHVFLGVLSALEFLSQAGVVHGKIAASNVLLSLYPREVCWRYRGYPDVLLAGFSGATMGRDDDAGNTAAEDVKGLLELISHVILNYSDSAPFIPLATIDAVMTTDDPLLRMLQSVREMGEGPEHIPRPLLKLLHSDIVSEEEMERALREPTVSKFEAKKEDFRKILAGEAVVMGFGGCAGMKTGRVIDFRFNTKKNDFLRRTGMAVDDESKEGTDADGEGEDVDEMEM